ncbi:MAG TPA: glycosyltransferase [Thermoanaerobaculia bacterium]|nr:glycosyltransferase [Thermoanaerobaculia bacterium]
MTPAPETPRQPVFAPASAEAASGTRSASESRGPRVFLGLSDICGYYQQLELGLREIGVDCTYVNAFPSPNRFARVTRPGVLGRIVEWVGRKRVRQREGSFGRRFWIAVQGFFLLLYFLGTLGKYDVYVFASGDSFLRGHDLGFLRLLGKRIIAVFHGSDSRPPYMNAAYVGSEGDLDPQRWNALTRSIKAAVRKIERNAVCIDHSMNGHFHERPFVNWLEIGIPSPEVAQLAETKRDNGQRSVIVHAPTRPGPKGTRAIESAVGSLQARGFDVELVTLVGRSNEEVLAALAESDFIVDELYSDTPMATFATEAASFGKPAIVGMHGFDALRRFCTEDTIPPAFVCRASEVEQAIETLHTDRERRLALGREAREFVRQRWSRVNVARRFLRVIENDIPAHWWIDPRRIDYLHGWGLTGDRLRAVLRACIEAGGVAALHVSDKPELQRRLVDFARGSANA